MKLTTKNPLLSLMAATSLAIGLTSAAAVSSANQEAAPVRATLSTAAEAIPASYWMGGTWNLGQRQQLAASVVIEQGRKTMQVLVELPERMLGGREFLVLTLPAASGPINFSMQNPDAGIYIGFSGQFQADRGLQGHLFVFDLASSQSAYGELRLRP